jgi:hypothetical protein
MVEESGHVKTITFSSILHSSTTELQGNAAAAKQAVPYFFFTG